MKTGFKDPIQDIPTKKMKSAWDFTCPEYDERSSNYINAGSHHGVGFRQPVGHPGNPKSTSPVLPKGRVDTMEVDQIPYRNLDIDFQK